MIVVGVLGQRLGLIAALPVAMTACGSRSGLEDSEAGSGGVTGTEGAPDEVSPIPTRPPPSVPPAAGASCGGNGGPSMVRLPEGYCIDSTEVTRAQYRAWLETSPSRRDQAPLCRNNQTFTPEPECMAHFSVCRTDCDRHPQVCVDWCDASAYCRAMGKRVCGKIGGGPNIVREDYAWLNPSSSQWHNACTSNGVNKYTMGNLYSTTACNGAEFGAGTTVPVGSLSGCQSPVPGYEGVYDLNGNVAEWEDSCDEVGLCRIRGAAFSISTDPGRMACAGDWSMSGGTALSEGRGWVSQTFYVGFRCCSSP